MAPIFEKETEGIYRLRIPFDTLYTSVFLVESERGPILVDCATTGDDVERYILPALSDRGYRATDLFALVLSHKHGDHAGGLPRLKELTPNLTVITDPCTLTKHLSVYPLGGHTEDAIGLLDTRTGTLIAADGIQGGGVDKYRTSVQNANAYLATLKRIEDDSRIQSLLFSHAYEPWLCDSLWGKEAVCACLADCKKYVGDTL